jgi:exopolyphosphatase/guanosine-5'-triphosphate,3'-diphosphate pyrophosphatase
MAGMRVAIVDVGSNTVRLLVASRSSDHVEPLREERAYLGLGAVVEREGRVPEEKIAQAANVARGFSRIARSLDADNVEVIVTAPGRLSDNADVLLAALACSTGWPVRILSADEEGRLAFAGALARADDLPESVAVCDVGGGSTEILVGTRSAGPVWGRSFELGSIRLTHRFFGSDPPDKRAVAALRAEVERRLAGIVPPLPQAALATGGSARALRKLVGRTLGAEELAEAVRILRRRPAARIAATFELDLLRARTLAAGAIVLAEAQRRLAVPFQVARGGLREGAALDLLAEAAAA